jgi:transposase-like protein
LSQGPAERASQAPSEEAGKLSDEERRLRASVLAYMRQHGGNVSAVARAMGKAPTQIHRWLKRFQLDPHLFRLRE